MADIPTFLKGEYEENWDFHEQLTQTLSEAIGVNGYEISQLTTAQIMTVTNMNYLPVLPAGTIFFCTDVTPVPQWWGIQTAASYGVSNAVLVSFNVTVI